MKSNIGRSLENLNETKNPFQKDLNELKNKRVMFVNILHRSSELSFETIDDPFHILSYENNLKNLEKKLNDLELNNNDIKLMKRVTESVKKEIYFGKAFISNLDDFSKKKITQSKLKELTFELERKFYVAERIDLGQKNVSHSRILSHEQMHKLYHMSAVDQKIPISRVKSKKDSNKDKDQDSVDKIDDKDREKFNEKLSMKFISDRIKNGKNMAESSINLNDKKNSQYFKKVYEDHAKKYSEKSRGGSSPKNQDKESVSSSIITDRKNAFFDKSLNRYAQSNSAKKEHSILDYPPQILDLTEKKNKAFKEIKSHPSMQTEDDYDVKVSNIKTNMTDMMNELYNINQNDKLESKIMSKNSASNLYKKTYDEKYLVSSERNVNIKDCNDSEVSSSKINIDSKDTIDRLHPEKLYQISQNLEELNNNLNLNTKSSVACNSLESFVNMNSISELKSPDFDTVNQEKSKINAMRPLKDTITPRGKNSFAAIYEQKSNNVTVPHLMKLSTQNEFRKMTDINTPSKTFNQTYDNRTSNSRYDNSRTSNDVISNKFKDLEEIIDIKSKLLSMQYKEMDSPNYKQNQTQTPNTISTKQYTEDMNLIKSEIKHLLGTSFKINTCYDKFQDITNELSDQKKAMTKIIDVLNSNEKILQSQDTISKIEDQEGPYKNANLYSGLMENKDDIRQLKKTIHHFVTNDELKNYVKFDKLTSRLMVMKELSAKESLDIEKEFVYTKSSICETKKDVLEKMNEKFEELKNENFLLHQRIEKLESVENLQNDTLVDNTYLAETIEESVTKKFQEDFETIRKKISHLDFDQHEILQTINIKNNKEIEKIKMSISSIKDEIVPQSNQKDSNTLNEGNTVSNILYEKIDAETKILNQKLTDEVNKLKLSIQILEESTASENNALLQDLDAVTKTSQDIILNVKFLEDYVKDLNESMDEKKEKQNFDKDQNFLDKVNTLLVDVQKNFETYKSDLSEETNVAINSFIIDNQKNFEDYKIDLSEELESKNENMILKFSSIENEYNQIVRDCNNFEGSIIDVQKNFEDYKNDLSEEIDSKFENMILKFSNIENENKQIVPDFNNFEGLINDVQKNFEDYKNDLSEEINSKNENMILKFSSIENENKQIVRDFNNFEGLIKKYNDYLTNKSVIDNDLKVKQEQLSSRINSIDEKIANVETEYSKKFETATSSIDNLSVNVKENLYKEVKDIWSQLSDLKSSQNDEVQDQNRKNDMTDLTRKVHQVQKESKIAFMNFKKYDDSIRSLKASENRIDTIQEETTNIQASLSKYDLIMTNLKKSEEKIQNLNFKKYDDSLKNLKEAENKIDLIQEETSSIQANLSKYDQMMEKLKLSEEKLHNVESKYESEQENLSKYDSIITNFKESSEKFMHFEQKFESEIWIGAKSKFESEIKALVDTEIKKVQENVTVLDTKLMENCYTTEVNETLIKELQEVLISFEDRVDELRKNKDVAVKYDPDMGELTQQINDITIKNNTEFCEMHNQIEYCYNQVLGINQAIDDRIQEKKDLEYSIFTEEDGPTTTSNTKNKNDNLINKIIAYEIKFDTRLSQVENSVAAHNYAQKIIEIENKFTIFESEITSTLKNILDETIREEFKDFSPKKQPSNIKSSEQMISLDIMDSEKKVANLLDNQLNTNLSIFKSKQDDYSFNMEYEQNLISPRMNEEIIKRIEILEEKIKNMTESPVKNLDDKSIMDEVHKEMNKTKDEMNLWMSRFSRIKDSKGVSLEQSLQYDNHVGISSHLSPHDSRAIHILGDQEHEMKQDFSHSHFSIDKMEHDKSMNDMQKDLNRMISFVHDLGNKQAMKVVEKLRNKELNVNEKFDAQDWLAKNIRFVSDNLTSSCIKICQDIHQKGKSHSEYIALFKTKHSSPINVTIKKIQNEVMESNEYEVFSKLTQNIMDLMEILLLSDFNLERCATLDIHMLLLKVVIEEKSDKLIRLQCQRNQSLMFKKGSVVRICMKNQTFSKMLSSCTINYSGSSHSIMFKLKMLSLAFTIPEICDFIIRLNSQMPVELIDLLDITRNNREALGDNISVIKHYSENTALLEFLKPVNKVIIIVELAKEVKSQRLRKDLIQVIKNLDCNNEISNLFVDANALNLIYENDF